MFCVRTTILAHFTGSGGSPIILSVPSQVILRQATNPEKRNFMQAAIGRGYISTALQELEPSVYKVRLDAPPSGFTAYYVEAHYPSEVVEPFKFTSTVKVVPDVTEYQWEMASDRARQR
jgi:PhoPQ-activated pathogenicity-related protein